MFLFGLCESTAIAVIMGYIFYRIAGLYIVSTIFSIGLICLFYIWHRASTVWQRLGVPSPPGRFFLGHYDQYAKKGTYVCDLEWSKKYGKIYGTYLYMYPELISDSELLKKILVKDFHNFTNRRLSNVPTNTLIGRTLFSLVDSDWKNTRNTITSAFTTRKLKEIVAIMENRINTFCGILDEQTDYENGVNVNSAMGNLTMDIIAATEFSADTDAQRNPNNEFVKELKQLAYISYKDWRMVASTIFPWLAKILDTYFDYQMYMPNLQQLFVKEWIQVIANRRQNPSISLFMCSIEKMDMLQLLINAVDDAEMGSDTVNYNGAQPMQKWKLTDRDVIAHSLNTVFAGYSPISTTLTLACYLLAWHPDIQKKCQEELTDTVNDDEPITYSHIQQGMPYLEGVISETLRLYPPVLRFDRVSQDDYQLTDKITIPKEAVVVIPVYAIHHDPENYEDPERFNPERFLESVNPLTYLPFGYGPRNCVGMRFAQLEMKLVLANIVRKFRIETCSKTEPMPMQLNVTRALQPKNPIRLNFKRQ